MAKYRLLREDELKQFEKEFIEYLVVNGIDAQQWVKLKDEQSQEAQKVLDLFSDVVFEKILRKAKYLLFANESAIYSFEYGDKDAQLYIVSPKDNIILEGMSTAEEVLNFIQAQHQKLEFQYQTKSYSQNREIEIFSMLESGCVMEDGSIFSFCVKQKSL